MESNERSARIKNLIDTEVDTKDFWNDLPEHVKESVNQAKVNLKSGQGIPHNKVMVEIKSEFLKK